MTDADSQEVDFWVSFFDDKDRLWRIVFTVSEDCPSGANMATVEKTSDDPDTWVFTATADDFACLQLREGGRKHFEFHGLYRMPFRITAEAQ